MNVQQLLLIKSNIHMLIWAKFQVGHFLVFTVAPIVIEV